MSEDYIDRSQLSKAANARYEASTFLSQYPEFFTTPENGRRMTDFMQEKHLALTAANFEYAFEQLKARGELLPSREVLANMNAAEIERLAKKVGTPTFDGFGNHNGYDWPDAYRAPDVD